MDNKCFYTKYSVSVNADLPIIGAFSVGLIQAAGSTGKIEVAFANDTEVTISGTSKFIGKRTSKEQNFTPLDTQSVIVKGIGEVKGTTEEETRGYTSTILKYTVGSPNDVITFNKNAKYNLLAYTIDDTVINIDDFKYSTKLFHIGKGTSTSNNGNLLASQAKGDISNLRNSKINYLSLAGTNVSGDIASFLAAHSDDTDLCYYLDGSKVTGDLSKSGKNQYYQHTLNPATWTKGGRVNCTAMGIYSERSSHFASNTDIDNMFIDQSTCSRVTGSINTHGGYANKINIICADTYIPSTEAQKAIYKLLNDKIFDAIKVNSLAFNIGTNSIIYNGVTYTL